MTGDDNAAARTMALLWRDALPVRRGPKQRIDIEEVIAEAITIADAEGLDAVTMRRVAEAVGVGTMSLYTYVPDRAALVELMVDRTVADAPLPAAARDWRHALEAIAHQAWGWYRGHPWLLAVSTARTVFGPHVLARYEAVLAVASTTGLPARDVVAVVSLVEGYVRGAAGSIADADQATARTGEAEADWWSARAPLLDERLAAGDYPTLTALAAAGAFDYPETGADWMAQRASEEFEYGLARLLDGVAMLIERHRRD